MNRIHVATAADLDDVLLLLNDTARWLKSRGLDQWGRGFGPDRIGPMIDRREVYIVRENDTPIATGAMSPNGDTDFWTPGELTTPAMYLNKVATARTHAGRGLGEALLRWLVDRAAQLGAELVRLDAWRTNTDLHDFYRRTGWEYLRTVELPHRKSGALFQRPALADAGALNAFLLYPPRDTDTPVRVGDQVAFDIEGGVAYGEVEGIAGDDGSETWGSAWSPGLASIPTSYTIRSGGRRYDRSARQVRRPAAAGEAA